MTETLDQTWHLELARKGEMTWPLAGAIDAIIHLAEDWTDPDDDRTKRVLDEATIADRAGISVRTLQRLWDGLEEGFRFRRWRKDPAKERQLPTAYDIDELRAQLEARRAQRRLPFDQDRVSASLADESGSQLQLDPTLDQDRAPGSPESADLPTGQPRAPVSTPDAQVASACVSGSPPRAARQDGVHRDQTKKIRSRSVNGSSKQHVRRKRRVASPQLTEEETRVLQEVRRAAPGFWREPAIHYIRERGVTFVRTALEYLQLERARRKIGDVAAWLCEILRTASLASMRRAIQTWRFRHRAELQRRGEASSYWDRNRSAFECSDDSTEDDAILEPSDIRELEATGLQHRDSGAPPASPVIELKPGRPLEAPASRPRPRPYTAIEEGEREAKELGIDTKRPWPQWWPELLERRRRACE